MERQMYDYFLDTGDLKNIMPNATGIWMEDKKEFTKLMAENEKLIDDDSILY